MDTGVHLSFFEHGKREKEEMAWANTNFNFMMNFFFFLFILDSRLYMRGPSK
jgi:hypothetical protein